MHTDCINNNKYAPQGGLQAWVVVLVSALFFFYEFTQMNLFNTINTDLRLAFHINATQVSNLSAAYFYADIILLFPAGIILDKFSTRKLLATAMCVTVVATFFLALTHSYWIAFSMRLLSGFGAAFNLLSSLRLASRWFPTSRLSLITGAVVTMAMLGGVVAQTPMTLLVNYVGWREAIIVNAAIGVIFLLLIIALVRDYPKNYQKSPISSKNHLSLWTTIKSILKNRQNWLGGCYTSFLNLPILVLGALWGKDYLMQVNGFSAESASAINSMLFVGTIVGSFAVGIIADSFNQRKSVMIIGALLSFVVMLLIRFWSHADVNTMWMLFLILGFTTSTQVLPYPIITKSNPLAVTGAALGMASVLIMAGGAVFQPIMGALLDLHHGVANAPVVYRVADYQFAFTIFPLMVLFGLICAVLIRDIRITPETI